MYLNPLPCTLENNLAGIKIGRRRIKTTVLAYADDVTIFVTSPTDIPVTQDALHWYEEESWGESKHRKIDGTSGSVHGTRQYGLWTSHITARQTF